MVRRVVAGGNTLRSDGSAPRERSFQATPGMSDTMLWAFGPDDAASIEDRTADSSELPGSRAVVFKRVEFPPQTAMRSAHFDPLAARSEAEQLTPQLAACFDDDGSGFHRTPTVDLVTVVAGNLTLEMGDGSVAALGPGDTVVQVAGYHRWINSADDPAVITVVHYGLAEEVA